MEKNQTLNLTLKCFTAVAFLLPADVIGTFLEMTCNDLVPIEILSYFEVNYIGAEPKNKPLKLTPLIQVEL